MSQKRVSIAVVGLGAIGKTLVRELAQSEHYELVAVAGRDVTKTRQTLNNLGFGSVLVVTPNAVSDHAELIIDAAPADAFRTFAEPTIRAGKELVVISIGALLDNWDLVELAEQTGAVIHAPSGAISGLDGVQAAARGEIISAKIVTRKPVAGLALDDAEPLTEPKQLYAGTVRDAFARFPANVNVAVALSLAGIGPDRTEIEVWADPSLTRNRHEVRVESDSGIIEVAVEGVPSENPKTGKITAQSILAWLAKRNNHLRIGT